MNKNSIGWILRILISLLFLVSAVAKMDPIWGFERQMVNLGIADWCSAPYFARIMLGIELAVAIAILQPHFLKKLVIPSTILLLIVFCTHLSIEMVKHGAMNGNCGCFGQLIPMTPLEAFIKNIVTIGLLVWLYKITTEKEFQHRFTIPLIIWLASTLFVFMAFPFCPCKTETTELTADATLSKDSLSVEEVPKDTSINKLNIPENETTTNAPAEIVDPGPSKVISSFSKHAIFNGKKINIDQGKAIVCFFAPGCDHCQATAKELAAMSKNKDFPPVYIFFMDEEAEKIPAFFEFAGKKFPYKIMDIPTFWTVIGPDGETPGVHYLWNGNIRKTFMGINEKAFNADELLKTIQQPSK
jgi:thiol-disulfide isomerase/thioredoxin